MEEALENVEHDHTRAECDAAALDRLRRRTGEKEERKRAVSREHGAASRTQSGGEHEEARTATSAARVLKPVDAQSKNIENVRAQSRTSKTFLITCGEVSKMLGHTKFKMCTSASSQLKPTHPRETCFTIAHAVWRCTASRSIKASSMSGAIA